jgi:hypothetical protein
VMSTRIASVCVGYLIITIRVCVLPIVTCTRVINSRAFSLVRSCLAYLARCLLTAVLRGVATCSKQLQSAPPASASAGHLCTVWPRTV